MRHTKHSPENATPHDALRTWSKPASFLSYHDSTAPSLLLASFVGLANFGPRCPPPNISSPPHQPLHGSSRRHSRADVEIEDWFSSGLWRCRVEIDHVSDFLGLTADITRDIPIVAIERRLGANPRRIQSVLSEPHADRMPKTYPNLAGYTRASICSMAAFGVISLGLP